MIAEIGICDLCVPCIIGTYPEERVKEQKLLISVSVKRDISAAAQSDYLGDALDYTALAGLCESCAQDGQFQLLEALAATILTSILEGYPDVLEAEICVKKPSAIAKARWTSVSVKGRNPMNAEGTEK